MNFSCPNFSFEFYIEVFDNMPSAIVRSCPNLVCRAGTRKNTWMEASVKEEEMLAYRATEPTEDIIKTKREKFGAWGRRRATTMTSPYFQKLVDHQFPTFQDL